MKHSILFLAAISALLVSLAGWAQPVRGAEQEQTVALEEVVVTATRGIEEVRKIPANVSVITAKDIEQSGAASVVEVLETLGNLNVRSYSGNPSQAMVDLRGFGENAFGKVLVMLDGRRMNRPDMASINWLQVPLATVDRIEVVRGSGAVLYGDAAAAGVIHIITKTGDGPPTVDGSLLLGSYGLHNERLGVSGSEGNYSYNLSGENLKTFGYRDRSKFSSKGGAFDLGYDATDRIRISLGLSYNETDYEMPGTLTKAQMAVNRRQHQPGNDSDESSDQYRNIKLKIDTLPGNLGEFSVGFAYGLKSFETDMTSWATFSDTEMATLAVTPQYTLEKTIAGFINKLTLGIDYYYETMDIDRFGSVQRTTQTQAVDFKKRSIGGYIRNELSIFPSLIFSCGFRAERASISGDFHDLVTGAPSPYDENKKRHRGKAWETGLTWLFGDRSNAFVRYGTFYRYPFIDEQATYWGFIPGADEFLMDIEKETGRSYEMGTRVFPLENLRLGITAYLIDMQDQIIWDNIAFRNRNLDKTRNQGLELNARYNVNDLFMLEGNATFNSSKFREGQHSGKDVPMAPRSVAYLALEVFLPGSLILRPEVHRVGDSFLMGDFENNGEKLEGRTVGNVYLRYRPRPMESMTLSAFLGIENITDEEYSTSGRDNSPWADNTYYPAPGRTIKGGLSVRF